MEPAGGSESSWDEDDAEEEARLEADLAALEAEEEAFAREEAEEAAAEAAAEAEIAKATTEAETVRSGYKDVDRAVASIEEAELALTELKDAIALGGEHHPRWVEERKPLEGTPASLSSMQMQASQQQGADQQQGAAEVLRELCGILPITSKTSPSSASSMTMMKSLRPGVDDQRALKKLAAATLSCLRNLKPRDGDNRVVVQARLQEVCALAVPGSTMQLFGSTACELHAHGADLDLTLQTQGPPPSYAEQQALVRH